MVDDEYAKALTQLATKYQLSARKSPLDKGPAPDELLDQLARWLRKHASPPQLLRALLKRIERLRAEVRISRQRNAGRDPRADWPDKS
jgi:hypothetical protein